MDINNNLSIFDGDFLLYSATMGNKCLDDDGVPIRLDNKFVYTDKTEEEVYACADQIITNILNISQADYYIGYVGGCKSFRYIVYPEYKGNRIKLGLPNYYNELKKYLVDKWNFIRTEEGLEADDAVNIARNNFQNDFSCTIVTSDKDLIKSISGRYLNTYKLELIETSQQDADYFFWKSMITGDPIDNIKGLTGRGEVFAKKILDLADDKHTPYSMEVFNQYIIHYKDELTGIEEFYKNYKCLKILDKFDKFTTPELNRYNKRQEEIEW